jgi:hypothetical protein
MRFSGSNPCPNSLIQSSDWRTAAPGFAFSSAAADALIIASSTCADTSGVPASCL